MICNQILWAELKLFYAELSTQWKQPLHLELRSRN